MTINLDLPDIEIDIPDLVEIKNELKRTQAQLTELRAYVSTQKVWNSALESALKLYGIDISSPPQHRSSLILPLPFTRESDEFFDPIITNIQSGVVNDIQPQIDRKPQLLRLLHENCEDSVINVNENGDGLQINEYLNGGQNRNGPIFSRPRSRMLATQSAEETAEEILPDIWQECEIDVLPVSNPYAKDDMNNHVEDTNGDSPNSRTRFGLRKITKPKATCSPYALPTKSGVVIKSLNSLNNGKRTLKRNRRKTGFTTVKRSKTKLSPIGSRNSKGPVKRNPGHFIEILPNSVPGAESSYKCKLCEYEINDLTKVVRHIRVKHLEERKHKCHFCSLTFMRNQHLIQHVLAKHKDTEAETMGLGGTGRSHDLTLAQSTIDCSIDLQTLPSSSRQSQFGISSEQLTAADNSVRIQQLDYEDEIRLQSMPENYLNRLRLQYQSFNNDENRTAYLCIACGTIDYSEQQMLIHIHSQHSNFQPTSSSPATLYVCDHCFKTFRTKLFLQYHMSSCKEAPSSSPTTQYETSNSLVEDFDEGHSSSNVRVNVVRPTFKTTGGIMSGLKRKKKRYNGIWAFSDQEKLFLDDRIENVANPKPPYVCKICKVTINSSRQSARRHVQRVHKYVDGIIQH